MPAPPYEPQPDLATQRVPGGRRAALVVAVLAIVVVGTLVWKPWDSGAPAASIAPRPTSRSDVASSTSTAPVVIMPTTAPTGTAELHLG